MSDRATPNLPSRSFDATIRFYAALGFAIQWRDDNWLILARDGLVLEFFPHPDLDPAESWFSCCLRLDDLSAFTALCRAAAIAEGRSGIPRLQSGEANAGPIRMDALIDPDGSLLRLIQT